MNNSLVATNAQITRPVLASQLPAAQLAAVASLALPTTQLLTVTIDETGPTRHIGFVLMSRAGKPVCTWHGGKKNAALYQHAGHARRCIRERHPKATLLPVVTKSAANVTTEDMLVGYCLIDAAGKPIRSNKRDNKIVRLYSHAGFAARGARYLGASGIRKVYI